MQKYKYFIPASWPRVDFSPYNRNFRFIPGWRQKIQFIQKIIFIKTKKDQKFFFQ